MRYAIFEIDYSYHQAMGEWLAHDDFRRTGWAKNPTKATARYVAPSQEVALAHFKRRNQYGLAQEEKFTIGDVRQVKLDAMLIEVNT